MLRQPQGAALEVVIVDNGSTDGAPEMTAREFPEVVLVRNSDNRGFSRANNQAARRSQGRYLLFLNNDTVVPAEAIGKLLAHAEAHPEAGIVAPRLVDPDGQTQASCRPKPTVATLLHRTCLLRWTGLLRPSYRHYRQREFSPETAQAVETLMGAAMLLRRDVFFDCGGWDEDYTFGGEDFDLSTRVGRDRPLLYFPDVTVMHLSRSSTRQNLAYSTPNVMIGFARYLRKSGSSAAAMFLYKLVVTLDAPLQMMEKLLQFTYRRLLGRPREADRSWRVAVGFWHFLRRGLGRFWQV